MFEQTKKFCDSFLTRGLIGFDLSLYHNGESVLRYMNGFSDLENEVKVSGSERYNIYSCSKFITCVAALQLYEKGLFNLDDKLSDFMPEFSEMKIQKEDSIVMAQEPILIKHLFDMTAGFSYNCNSDKIKEAIAETSGRCPTREVMKYLAKEPLLFEPGDRWNYSFCHDVLAALIEVLTNKKFYEYVEENIFRPLGMTSSTFMLLANELDTLSPQYYYYQNGTISKTSKEICSFKLGSEYSSGGAGCVSTVDDYIKFLEGVRTYRLLKPETIALMTTDHLNGDMAVNYWEKKSHGYGLGVRCQKKDGKFVDFGWSGAAGAFAAVDIENNISLYFGTHLFSSPIQGVRTMIYRLAITELLFPNNVTNVVKEIETIYGYSF